METPAPPWRTARKQPRRQLSQELIVETGLRILDDEGLEAVSMRRVAQELNTGPASLYAHVANKEELLELMYEQVIGEIELPAPDDPRPWQEQIREIVRNSQRTLARHGSIAATVMAGVPTGPNSMRMAERMLGVMLGGGIPKRVATMAMDRLAMYITADVYESSLYQSMWRASGKEREQFVTDYFGQIREYFLSLPPERFPHLSASVEEMLEGDGDERFEFGLDLIIAGIEARLKS
ncbi:TetR/AcrR family transcriptional regulator [Nonomuraea sp. NPDC050310]|uniref:TetR/AcrR family transcriptional regulator n=1 Tax=unclassified Nonomuraea TaxID=2593643 RepID=UPI0033E8D9E7